MAIVNVVYGADWEPNSPGLVRAWTDNSNTEVLVEQQGQEVVLQDLVSGRSWRFPKANVGRVAVFGGSGADQFRSELSSIRVEFHGFGGDDQLIGGSADDVLVGGEGNDLLIGRGGKDTMRGDAGNDQIVALDGAASDIVFGGVGRDILWADKVADTVDNLSDQSASDLAHEISTFANGVDKSLDGDAILDPQGDVYQSFANRPLFSAQGPQAADIKQGAVGNCPVLASMAAVAHQNPQAYRDNMVDFGDGTFGVKLQNQFFRIDADLPISSWNNMPKYAQLGADESLWPSLFEKALVVQALSRGQTPAENFDYDLLRGLDSSHVLMGLGSNERYPDRYPHYYPNSQEWLAEIYQQWSSNNNVSVGVRVTDNVPLVGSHAYTVMSIATDSQGAVQSFVLRNPWGVDGVSDGSDPNDGIVTVTAEQFLIAIYSASWSKLPVQNQTPEITTLVQLDRDLNLRTTGNYFLNWGGQQEKWVIGEGNVWYFVKPNGDLHQWNPRQFSSSPLVTRVDVAAYHNLDLLHEAFDVVKAQYSNAETIVPRSSVVRFDERLDLTLHSSGDRYNELGMQERWVVSEATGVWYVIKPTGDFYERTSSSELHWLGRVPQIAHSNIEVLAYGSEVSETVKQLDSTLSFSSSAPYFFNWGKMNEKWLWSQSRREWYFIKPNGELYRWHGGAMSNSTLIVQLSSKVHSHPKLLTDATQLRIG